MCVAGTIIDVSLIFFQGKSDNDIGAGKSDRKNRCKSSTGPMQSSVARDPNRLRLSPLHNAVVGAVEVYVI